MQKDRLLKRINSYFIVHTLTKVFSFCLVLLYAFYISPDELGEYEYIQSLINIIVPFFFLSIWESILKFGLKSEEYSKEKVIGTSAIFTFVASAILIIGCISWAIFKNITDIWYVVFVTLTYILDSLVIMWQHYLKVLDKYKLYVKSAAIGSVVSILAALILVICLKLQLEALFISSLLGMFVTFVLIEIKEKIVIYIRKEKIDYKLLKEMLSYSLPLVISAVLTWFVTGLSKTVIQNYISSDANGLYSFAHKFTIVITFASTIVNTAVTEEMLTLSQEKFKEDFSNVTNKLFEAFFMIAIIFMPVIMGVYKIIQKTEYYNSKQFVAPLILYFILLTMANHIATTFKVYNKNKYNMLSTLLGATVTIGIMVLAINKFKVMGVVISQVAGAIVMYIMVYLLSRKNIKMSIEYFKILKYVLLYILITSITYVGNWYVILLTWLFTLMYFKGNILDIVKEYKGSKSEKNI